MPKRKQFLVPEWSGRFQKSYGKLPADGQRRCDEAVMALIKQESSPGLHIKPILPAKYYHEARIDRGNRIIFRRDGDVIFFVDVVAHDDIKRYSTRAAV